MDKLRINHTGANILRAGNNVLGSSFFLSNLFGSLGAGNKWFGGVLAPNGKIYGIPYGSTQVLEIDESTMGRQAAIDNLIPANLDNLAASNYNKYQNKL